MDRRRKQPLHEGERAPHRKPEDEYATPFAEQFRQQLPEDEDELRRAE